MTPLTQRDLLVRFVVLTFLRWLPVGLLIPVMVLLPLDRGLGIAEIGSAFAVQGFVVLALELPTGGFADSLGRRPVLLVASVVAAASYAVLLMADSFWWLVVVAALQGIYRALDSGPLDSWYIDAVHEIDPDARIESGMSAHGVALGVGVAGGAVISGGLVALDPFDGIEALVLPVLIALVLQIVGIASIALLMVEHRPARAAGLLASVRETPRAIADGIGLLRSSRVLLALVAVELFWGFGMVAFESLLPIRLSEVSGGTEAAAAITGPATAAAWAASAAGAAITGWVAARTGTAVAAMAMRVLQGAFVVLLGVFGGVVGILVAFFACYAVHGASNVVHMSLVHRQVGPEARATVVSLNSMVAQPAGAVGMIVLSGVADGISVSIAMFVGGVVLALAAPLYLPALRQERASSVADREAVAH